jgi:gas vesicle protein
MAYEYDRFEREDGGGSFLMGLLAGTVLGAGLGMLFAPKAGSDLRSQLTEQAGKLRTTANDGIQQASGKVGDTLQQASGKVSDTLQQASGKVNETIQAASGKVTDSIQQASGKVTEMVDRGKEAYERARNNVNDAAADAAGPGEGAPQIPTGPAGYSGPGSSNRS